MPTETAEAQIENPVVVTTDHRGVFFGYVVPTEPTFAKTIKLSRARMCIYWDSKVGGVIGLAATGPNKQSRVGPACPSITLQGVTAVMDATDEAAVAWEAQPWGR